MSATSKKSVGDKLLKAAKLVDYGITDFSCIAIRIADGHGLIWRSTMARRWPMVCGFADMEKMGDALDKLSNTKHRAKRVRVLLLLMVREMVLSGDMDWREFR